MKTANKSVKMWPLPLFLLNASPRNLEYLGVLQVHPLEAAAVPAQAEEGGGRQAAAVGQGEAFELRAEERHHLQEAAAEGEHAAFTTILQDTS